MVHHRVNLITKEEYPKVFTKDFLLSKMPILKDIEIKHESKFISNNMSINIYKISSINGVELIYPLTFNETTDENDRQFNLAKVEDNYGSYYLIRGKFSYDEISKTDLGKKFIRWTFNCWLYK